MEYGLQKIKDSCWSLFYFSGILIIKEHRQQRYPWRKSEGIFLEIKKGAKKSLRSKKAPPS